MQKTLRLVIFQTITVLCLGMVIFWGCRTNIRYTRIFLITFDSARWDFFPRWCGNKSRIPTSMPNLERICRYSLVFTKAYTPYPATAPALASLYTGFPPPYHRVTLDNPLFLSPAFPTLAETLKRYGYETHIFAGNHWFLDPRTRLNRGFLQVTFFPTLHNAINPEKLVEKAIQSLDKDCRRRCFIHLHLFQPHSPYGGPRQYFYHPPEVPESYANPLKIQGSLYPQRDYLIEHYRTSLRWADDALGKLFKHISSRFKKDRTLMIITSDHGEGFGEHQLWGHGNGIFEEAVHVPLIIYTGRRRYKEVQKLVSIEDLNGTIARAAGIPHRYIPPTSIAIDLNDDSSKSRSERQFILLSGHDKQESMGIILGRYKYIFQKSSHLASLYDLQNDPDEKKNIIAKEFQWARIMHDFMLDFMNGDITPSSDLVQVIKEYNNSRTSHNVLRTLGYTEVQFMEYPRTFLIHPQSFPLQEIKVRGILTQRYYPESFKKLGFRLKLTNVGNIALPSTVLPHQPKVQVYCRWKNSISDIVTLKLKQDLYPGKTIHLDGSITPSMSEGRGVLSCSLGRFDFEGRMSWPSNLKRPAGTVK